MMHSLASVLHTSVLHASSLNTGILDPQPLIDGAGAWGLLVVCAIAFAETALLIGFFLPGDTLLFLAGVLTLTGHITQPLWLVVSAVAVAAIAGEQVGYQIGRSSGPAVFERKESGLFSRASVERSERFFVRFGPLAILLARFVPVVRTFIPVAAGVGRMRRDLFFIFNLIGAVVWSSIVIGAGYLLGRIPGVAAFVSNDLDLILIAVIVVSVVPILIRAVIVRARIRNARQVDS